MEENIVAQGFQDVSNGFYDLGKTIEKVAPKTDRAFEIFKTLVPDLWQKYNDLPSSEFEDVVKDAAKFSVVAALGFNHHAQHRDVVMAFLDRQVLEKTDSV